MHRTVLHSLFPIGRTVDSIHMHLPRFSGSFQYGDTSKGGLIRNGKERIQIGVSLENIFRGFHRGLCRFAKKIKLICI